jgi:hypothetical protein
LFLLALIGVVCLQPRTARASLRNAGSLVNIDVRASKDSVRVGERLRVTYTIDYPDSLEFNRFGRLPEGKFRQLSLSWRESRTKQGKRAVARAEIMTLDLEEAFVPELRLIFTTGGGDSLYAIAGGIRVPVKLVSGDNAELKPLKKQWKAPPSYSWLIALVAAVLLAAAILYYLRRRKRRRTEEEPARPELPADFVALRELARIEKSGLLDSGEFKKYYSEVVDVLRKYLEARYGITAMDRTTDEILAELGGIRVGVEGLEELLREADLVKFAKFEPGIVPGKRVMETARKIVTATAPPRVEETAQAAASNEGR